jgi:hypothetical protein
MTHRDYLVLCPGGVTRTFGTPGGEQHGRGMKTLAQATHLHDHARAELELGNAVSDEQRRGAHCTFVVADAGPGPAVDVGGTQAVARPLGRHLTGVPAQLVTRGYHLHARQTAAILARDLGRWPE